MGDEEEKKEQGNKAMSLRMPAEHGAWGILLAPFICAAALAGAWNWPLLLAAVCAVSFFLLRGSMEAHGEWKALVQPAHLVLAFLGSVTACLLIFFYQRYQFMGTGLAAAGLYLLQRCLAQSPREARKEKRSLAAELIGVLLLTLAAPAAWISALGHLDATGARVWLLNLLFFLGGVLYVKYRVRGVAAHRTFHHLGERFAFAWPVVVYHFLVLAFLTSWILLESFPLTVILAFIPAVSRATGLLFHLGRRFPIRRLGWSEVLHSVIFAVLLILAFHQTA